jgi:hypothetical protein
MSSSKALQDLIQGRRIKLSAASAGLLQRQFAEQRAFH